MASSRSSQSRSSRAPLSDATGRVVNAPPRHAAKPTQNQDLEINPLRAHPVSNAERQSSRPQPSKEATQRQSTSTATRTGNDDADPEKRVSQISSSSGASSGKRKTHIGPWQLGKTLGKGSAGRVRLARHHATREQVAVKILPKFNQHMTQAGSLANIDAWDRNQPEFTAEKRMPLSIEREVAILKLIDHPNIMKLFDIWENRSEIYLVLEYVEQGDLFEYINCVGPIPELETVFYFRQIISALDYCHSFNICHRDLKPENILLTSKGQVKIADFGMAAIQQGPNHRLKTACGSPHYAAPELVDRKRSGYNGATIDVWSSGVILYACLCARLPFDDRDMHELLRKARKGIYDEPKLLSPAMKDLLRKMLTPQPEARITIARIWKHPLITQYDELDDLNGKRHDDDLDDIRKYGRSTRVEPQDIDMQTLRQLHSMWHTFTERELAMKLVTDEPNDQKLFYWLLFNYREKRLENYVGEMTHSPSDYHHLRPANWTKKFTTLEFPGRYGRTPSRFTVISNVATDENGIETATDCGTIQSYDPYKSSRIMGGPDASHAKITVHRNGSLAKSSTRATNMPRMKSGSIRSNSTYSRRGGRGRQFAASVGMGASRRSLTSIKSAGSTPYSRPASRHTRGVNFSHARRPSVAQRRQRAAPASIAGDDTTYGRDRTSPIAPRRRAVPSRSHASAGAATQSMVNVTKTKDAHFHWNDELRQFSYSIAKDCDEAFNSSLLSPDTNIRESTLEPTTLVSSMVDLTCDTRSLPVVVTPTPSPAVQQAVAGTNRDSHLWDMRPLPPPPPATESVSREIRLAKKRTARRASKDDESPGHLDRMMQHLQTLDRSIDPKKSEETSRTVSAPIYSQYSTQWGKDKIPLPSISEGRRGSSTRENDRQRTVSAPSGDTPIAQSTPKYFSERNGLEYLSQQENTIRMVTSPSDFAQVPAPLNVRKKVSRGVPGTPQARQQLNLRQQYVNDEMREPIPEEPSTPSQNDSLPEPVRKRSWFKRASKDKSDLYGAKAVLDSSRMEVASQAGSAPLTATPIPPHKKKSFSLAFWQKNKNETQMKLSLADVDFDDSPSPEPVRMFSHPARPHHGQWKENVATRNIEPQQNWLARLFRVKPATEHLCFTIPRRRTRQEIAILLREWRQYGIRDVQVDKDRNLVFGRVGPKNYLNMKEVSFAAEIMTVIEHGKRNPLSIVRFTQERGAASSFHKVVDTMHAVFSVRNLLVVDKHKIKMMIRTLNS
ncbi:hypothetical protein JX266_008801 [Neoarthrinium moseri]|nr:hypothetical protein JX266_008801 [Neoarthrinium moseri]